MAKTAEVTALTLTVDPRVRMKEIRAMVANHLKGKPVSEDLGYLSHLGDLPDNMEDARRVIIAAQDEAEKARERHRKATKHICELVHLVEHMMSVQEDLLIQIDNAGRQIRQMDDHIQLQQKRANIVYQQSAQSSYERDAVLTTMKLLNMQPKAEAVTMGYSNKEQG